MNGSGNGHITMLYYMSLFQSLYIWKYYDKDIFAGQKDGIALCDVRRTYITLGIALKHSGGWTTEQQ